MFRLLNFEFNRIFKLLVGLSIGVFGIQLISVIISTISYKESVIESNLREGMTLQEIVETYGLFEAYYITLNNLFFLPVGICAGVILFSIFFIWYRDWAGKNTFMYRLMMLPQSRMTIYYAKLLTIMITVLSLAFIQYLYLYIYAIVVKLILPSQYIGSLNPSDMISQSSLQVVLVPDTLLFISAYLIGTLFVMMMFTLILLERSYKFVGLLIGGLYLFVIASLIIGFVVHQYIFNPYPYFYKTELVIIAILAWLILTLITFIWNRHLMKRKITV